MANRLQENNTAGHVIHVLCWSRFGFSLVFSCLSVSCSDILKSVEGWENCPDKGLAVSYSSMWYLHAQAIRPSLIDIRRAAYGTWSLVVTLNEGAHGAAMPFVYLKYHPFLWIILQARTRMLFISAWRHPGKSRLPDSPAGGVISYSNLCR